MNDHKCKTCINNFATCHPKDVVFGIDNDPLARGADADKVLKCSSYQITQNSPNQKNLSV